METEIKRKYSRVDYNWAIQSIAHKSKGQLKVYREDHLNKLIDERNSADNKKC